MKPLSVNGQPWTPADCPGIRAWQVAGPDGFIDKLDRPVGEPYTIPEPPPDKPVTVMR